MQYTKCLRCGLNYVPFGEQLCKVCQDEIEGKRSIFDDEEYDVIVCPYCEKVAINAEELMCANCQAKRCKKNGNV